MRSPLLAAAALLCSSLGAHADQLEATYEVRWLGVRIATSRITSKVDGANYELSITSDYSVLLASGRITGEARGRVADGRPTPASYRLGATGDPEQRSAITFAGGAARQITIEPPLPPNWNVGRVALRPEHQQGVLDPLSALVLASLRAGRGPEEACRTSLPVFSGVSRFDVVLSPADPPRPARGERPPPGPPPILCRLRFVPVSGHRPANSTIRTLERAEAMRIEFERETVGAVRLPRRIEIPTRWGTVSILRRT